MTYEIVIPVIVSFAISALLGPIVIPFLRSRTDGAEGTGIPSEEKRNAYDGRTYDIGKYYHHIGVLCKRLSKDHSGIIYDCRIWYCRIFG